MKKIVAFLLVAICLFVVTGCTSTPAPDNSGSVNPETNSPSAEKKKVSIAVLLESIDVSYQEHYDQMKAYVDYYNSTNTDDIEISISLFDGQKSVDKQISDIETCIAMKIDAIVISAVDNIGIKPECLKAMEAGIKVIDWRNMGDMTVTLLSGGNEVTKGGMNYKWTKEYLEANPDVSFNACLLQGPVNVTVTLPRMEAMNPLAEEMPDRFKINSVQYGDWGTDSAIKIMEDWLQAFPDTNFVSVANEQMAMGVASVLKSAGLTDKVIVTTFNGEQLGLDLLEEGAISMTVGTILPLNMKLTIQACLAAVLDDFTGTVDAEDLLLYTVTRDNMEEYSKLIKCDYTDPSLFYNSINLSDIID